MSDDKRVRTFLSEATLHVFKFKDKGERLLSRED